MLSPQFFYESRWQLVLRTPRGSNIIVTGY